MCACVRAREAETQRDRKRGRDSHLAPPPPHSAMSVTTLCLPVLYCLLVLYARAEFVAVVPDVPRVSTWSSDWELYTPPAATASDAGRMGLPTLDRMVPSFCSMRSANKGGGLRPSATQDGKSWGTLSDYPCSNAYDGKLNTMTRYCVDDDDAPFTLSLYRDPPWPIVDSVGVFVGSERYATGHAGINIAVEADYRKGYDAAGVEPGCSDLDDANAPCWCKLRCPAGQTRAAITGTVVRLVVTATSNPDGWATYSLLPLTRNKDGETMEKVRTQLIHYSVSVHA